MVKRVIISILIFLPLLACSESQPDVAPVAPRHDNYSIKAYKYGGNDHGVEKVLWVDNATDRFYFSDGITSEKRYVFSFKKAFHGVSSAAYSCLVLPNDDVLFVYRTEFYGSISVPSHEIRENPIIFVASKGYEPVEIVFSGRVPPTGWLQDVGAVYSAAADALFISEYTRGNVPEAMCWKVKLPADNPDNWEVVLRKDIVMPYGKGFKHFHTSQLDPYTGAVYFTSGDDDTSSGLWCQRSGGSLTQIGGYDRGKWRMLNMVFTRDFIYWATDDWAYNHVLWRASRGSDGVLDPETLVRLYSFTDGDALTKRGDALYSRIATYATVYLKQFNALLMLDRDDEGVHNAIDVRIYDIDEGKCYMAATVTPLMYGEPWGFRCETVTLTPNGNEVVVSFGGNYPNKISVAGNTASTPTKQVNTMVLSIDKNETYHVTFSPL